MIKLFEEIYKLNEYGIFKDGEDEEYEEEMYDVYDTGMKVVVKTFKDKKDAMLFKRGKSYYKIRPRMVKRMHYAPRYKIWDN